ncbi:MAG: hypothetical protein SGARI_002126 [Bacillariaceae sp.]
MDKGASIKKQSETKHNEEIENDKGRNDALPYPEGQPWRVLWPQPRHHTTQIAKEKHQLRKIPRVADCRRAWALYKETWEDGITGRPSAAKLERLRLEELERELAEADARLETSTVKADSSDNHNETEEKIKEVGDNAARNIRLIRKDAQLLLDQAKTQSGIHSQDDLKAVASQMMQVATECIKEFMAGYRKGRDDEIDKMLNEYFKEEDNESSMASSPGTGRIER